MVRIFFISFFVFICSLFARSQNQFVDLEVSPKSVEVGQAVTITIKTNVDGDLDMILPDEFIQSGAVQSGMSSSIEYVNGRQKAIRYNFQSFTGYFEGEGKFTIGPVKVNTKNKEYASKSFIINVSSRQNMISDDPSKNLNQLVFGIIQQSKQEIYEGESIVLEGKVFAQAEILRVENYTPFKLDGPAESHALGRPNQVTSAYEVINGKDIQTFRIGKQLMFPETVGEFTILPFQTIIAYNDPRKIFPEREKVVSNTTVLTVKPLPEGVPEYFIDAVGKFELNAKLANTRLDQGDVVELKVEISGEGNLHNIKNPEIKLPHGLSFYGDPEITDSISFTSNGAVGTKYFTYFIQVNKGGDVHLNPVKIAYFDPTNESYEVISAKVKTLRVKPDADAPELEEREEEQEVEDPVMLPYVVKYQKDKVQPVSLLTGWGGTLLFCSPIMLGFLLGMVVRLNKKNQTKKDFLKQESQLRSDIFNELNTLKTVDNNSDKVIQITQLLIMFLAHQFGVQKGEITRALLKKNVPELLSQKQYEAFINVFDELDLLKYGGSFNDTDINPLIDRIEVLIKGFTK